MVEKCCTFYNNGGEPSAPKVMSATRKCHFIMSRSRDIIFNRIRVITARNDKLILWNKIYRGNWATMDTGEP